MVAFLAQFFFLFFFSVSFVSPGVFKGSCPVLKHSIFCLITKVAVASFFETENDNEMDPDSPEVLEQVTNPPERFVPEPQAPPQSRPSGTKKSKSKSKSYSR